MSRLKLRGGITLEDVLAAFDCPLEDACTCDGCEKKASEAGEIECSCGYIGSYVALGCECYDENRWYCRTGSPGSGCPHGGLTCPWCLAGELSGFDTLKSLRDLLFEKPSEEGTTYQDWGLSEQYALPPTLEVVEP